eukprot:6198711-Pleurochrysis_carterae.AAC.1
MATEGDFTWKYNSNSDAQDGVERLQLMTAAVGDTLFDEDFGEVKLLGTREDEDTFLVKVPVSGEKLSRPKASICTTATRRAFFGSE